MGNEVCSARRTTATFFYDFFNMVAYRQRQTWDRYHLRVFVTILVILVKKVFGIDTVTSKNIVFVTDTILYYFSIR